jgi:hypothetical protein
VGSRIFLDAVEKRRILPCRGSNPGRPARRYTDQAIPTPSQKTVLCNIDFVRSSVLWVTLASSPFLSALYSSLFHAPRGTERCSTEGSGAEQKIPDCITTSEIPNFPRAHTQTHHFQYPNYSCGVHWLEHTTTSHSGKAAAPCEHVSSNSEIPQVEFGYRMIKWARHVSMHEEAEK